MPPFNANAPLGHFQSDGRLTDGQIDLLVRWIDTGAPEGNPADAPPPVTWDSAGWALGTPDMVLEFPEYTSKTNNTDEEVLLFSDHVFDRHTWIQAIELKSTDYRILHHAGIVSANDKFFVPEDRILDSTDEHLDKFGGASNGGLQLVAQNFLYTWLPGQRVQRRPDGEGFHIAKGERLVIQTHIAPSAEAVPLKISLGLKFVNGDLRAHSKEVVVWMTDLRVPPGAPSYVLSQWKDVVAQMAVSGFNVHMHLRGKSAQIVFHYPDGRSETVLDVPHYDFNWQRLYILSTPMSVPAGTRIQFIGEWDNSPNNPRNPDPTKEVIWGGKTTDEMYSANVYFSEQRQYPVRVADGHVVGPAPPE